MLAEIGNISIQDTPADEDSEAEEHSQEKTLVIFDARSSTAAQLNRFKGGGVENESNYTNCILEFGDIENIHKVRDAYKKCFLSWQGKFL